MGFRLEQHLRLPGEKLTMLPRSLNETEEKIRGGCGMKMEGWK